MMSSGSSLRASVLGALNLACGAFENIEQIWVVGSQQIPPVIVPRCPSKFTGPGGTVHAGNPGLLSLRGFSALRHGRALIFWPWTLPVVCVSPPAHCVWGLEKATLECSGSFKFCFNRL